AAGGSGPRQPRRFIVDRDGQRRKSPTLALCCAIERGASGLDAAVEGLKTSGVNPRCKCFSRACKPRRCLNVCLNATPYLMLCLGTRCSDSRFVTGTRRSNANYERIGGTTPSMADQALFELKGVRVTPHIATFGGTSYQIANIGSIHVVPRRKYNPFAIIIFLLGLGIFVAAMVKSRMTGLAEESFSMAAT